MYYFFGAGANCHGAIEFWGKENVIAIVDNNEVKQGKFIDGIPIISFEKFLKQYKQEKIIITAFIASEQIIGQLIEKELYNYYVSPYMTAGFWSAKKIVERINILENKSVIFFGNNPITERIIMEIKKSSDIEYMVTEDNEAWYQTTNTPIVITKEGVFLSEVLHNSINIFEMMKNEKNDIYCELKKYKDLHKGESCFLVGNGPSLQAEDLEIIYKKKISSIGCNSIYRIFEKTNWRPDYYVIGDPFVYESTCKELLQYDFTYLIRDFGRKYGNPKKVLFYTSFGERYFPKYPKFSGNLVEGVYGARTVMYDMLQIAVYMGFKDIYLIGVDFTWGKDGTATHFCETGIDRKIIEDASRYKKEVEHGFISAKKFAEKIGVNIYNATRGGELEIFERIDINKFLERGV